MAVEDLSADNFKVALLPVAELQDWTPGCIPAPPSQPWAFAFVGAEVGEWYIGPWNWASAAPGHVCLCHSHRASDNLWQTSACDQALNSLTFWLSECPMSWDCSVANSASRVTLRGFVCKKRPETMNLCFVLNANQNMIVYVPFTRANMLSLWLFDFCAVTKR